MKIKETFIVEYQKRDSYGEKYEELIKLHHCINQDGSSNKYFIEHKSIKYDKKPKYGVKGFLKED